MDRPPDHQPASSSEPVLPEDRETAEMGAETPVAARPEGDVPEPAAETASPWVVSGELGDRQFTDPDGTPPYGTRVVRPPRPADPLAVAVGNASLLGVGYVLLGRRGLAVLAGLVSLVLLLLLVSVAPVLWFEVLVLVWWVAVVVHGWVLARRRERLAGARVHRLAALAAALPVLLVFGLLRFDAAGVERDIAGARADGDCAGAVAAAGRLRFGHRVVNAPLDERAEVTVHACDRLRTAGSELRTALSGDTGALAAGFTGLAGVLRDLPGHDAMVASTVDRFLGELPVDDPCQTMAVTDWLGREKPRGDVLGRAAAVVPRIAPQAIVGCADDHMGRNDWQFARARYQQLLDQYPGHDLAEEARAGVVKATQAIELANVRGLLTSAGGALPSYCTSPAPYSGAKPYVPKAPNRALVFGNTDHTRKIPPGWRAKDAADAVIVICAGETEYGTPVQTCPYEAKAGLFGYTDVTFKKRAIPLRVFEVRTGKLVADVTLQIGGASCPAVLEYTSYSYVDLGPPSEVYVASSDEDILAAFRPLLVR